MNVVDSLHNALVYDFGSSTVRFGYAGDAFPLMRIPSSSVQRFYEGEEHIQFGDEWFEKNLSGIKVEQMVDDMGLITDSDILYTFFDWVLSVFAIDEPSQHPILFSQPTALTKLTGDESGIRKWRSKLASCVFEFADHPALCLQHDSSLACYAHGIHTGLCVDYGWSCARCIPVVEGHPLKESVFIHPLGGLQLTNLLFEKMKQNQKEIYTFLDPAPSGADEFDSNRSFTPTESQVNYCVRHELTNIIQNHLRYSDVPPKDNDEDILDYIYFMPGRRPVEVKDEINFLSGLLWKPDPVVPQSQIPLQEIICRAINSAPKDIQPTLWKNIITSGGLSKIQGFNSMLEKKLNEIVPGNIHPHVIPPLSDSSSGSFCVWTGGSIVASLPRFNELCITREEWDEVGENILRTKCL